MPRIKPLLTFRFQNIHIELLQPSNVQVVRKPNLYNEKNKSLTLAEKAREMRTREEEKTVSDNSKKFETLANRAQRKHSPSPEAARRDERARSPQRKAGGPVFARLGPKY